MAEGKIIIVNLLGEAPRRCGENDGTVGWAGGGGEQGCW
eukprot:COSAG02_NODE_396_length_23126_cov_282.150258_31_plen_39_part_00